MNVSHSVEEWDLWHDSLSLSLSPCQRRDGRDSDWQWNHTWINCFYVSLIDSNSDYFPLHNYIPRLRAFRSRLARDIAPRRENFNENTVRVKVYRNAINISRSQRSFPSLVRTRGRERALWKSAYFDFSDKTAIAEAAQCVNRSVTVKLFSDQINLRPKTGRY